MSEEQDVLRRSTSSSKRLQLWSKQRLTAHHVFKSQLFEFILSGIIIFNLTMLVVETDISQDGQPVPDWMKMLSRILLLTFSIELGVRIYVYRIEFFKDPMCLMDAFVVTMDVVSLILELVAEGMGGLSILRIIRLMRLSRAKLIVEKVPELSMLARSLIGALKPIFWGSIILIFLFAAWGVLAVQFIHPLNENLTRMGVYEDCERCPRAYKSVWQSSLTMMQQIIAGDAWGSVTLPIIEHYPYAGVFFILMFISLEVALMNVILASVVDSAAQARVDDLSRDDVKVKLVELCESLDSDGSGCITFEELKNGFAYNRDFKRRMLKMDIHESDAQVVWDLIDTDDSGTINSQEFINELLKMKNSDPHTMLIMIRHYVTEIRDKVNDQVHLIQTLIEEANAKQEEFAKELQKEEKETLGVIRDMEQAQHQILALQPSLGNVKMGNFEDPGTTGQRYVIDGDFMTEQRQFMAKMVEGIKEVKQKVETSTSISLPQLRAPFAITQDFATLQDARTADTWQSPADIGDYRNQAPPRTVGQIPSQSPANIRDYRSQSPDAGANRQQTPMNMVFPSTSAGILQMPASTAGQQTVIHVEPRSLSAGNLQMPNTRAGLPLSLFPDYACCSLSSARAPRSPRQP